MAKEEVAKWRNIYSVLTPEDHDRLEANAAVHEFRGGESKEQAEQKAHKDYLKDHALNSAAWHYLGMRAASATNNDPAAKSHGKAYSLAMNHLGLNPLDTPPKELLDRAKDIDKSPYAFKAHDADSFFEPKVEIPGVKEEPANRTQELLERLKSLKQRTI